MEELKKQIGAREKLSDREYDLMSSWWRGYCSGAKLSPEQYEEGSDFLFQLTLNYAR